MFSRMIILLLAMFWVSTAAFAKKITFDEKTLILRGDVTSESVAVLQEAILTSTEKELTLVLVSPGGSVGAGADLSQVIRDSGKNIRCVAPFAASMAFAILQACQERYVLENSIVMQHVMSYSLSGEEPNNYSLATAFRRLNKRMDVEQAERIGMSYEEFREKVRDDWWLLGSEAVDAGVADDVISATCTPSLTKKRIKETVELEFWKFNVEWSGCPLIQTPVSIVAVDKDEFGIDSDNKRKEYKDFMGRVNIAASMKHRYIHRRSKY